MLRLLVGLLSLMLALGGLSLAAEIEVHPGELIYGALLDAQPGDVVIVHCGQYRENNMLFPEGVTLRSHSGDPDCVSIISDGQFPIFYYNGVTSASQIQGVTFTCEPAAGDGPARAGGAVHLLSSAMQFANCRFENLVADYGGAVYCSDGAQPTFTDCVFRGNHARAVGGAIACVNNSQPTLVNCLVVENSAGAIGGAFNLARDSQIILERTTVAANEVGAGPATSLWDGSRITATASIVVDVDLWIGDSDLLYQADCSDVYAGGQAVPVDPVYGSYISVDPLFCLTLAGDSKFNLDEASPCTPENAPECGGMGVMPVGCSVSSTPEVLLPQVTRLNAIYPNPFNPRTIIKFDLGKPGTVNLAVYDIAGRQVTTLVDEFRPGGSYEAAWHGHDQRGQRSAAGVYFIRLKTPERIDTQRITLVK